MSRRKKTKPSAPPIDVVDVSEWSVLATQIKEYCPQKHDEILDALRKITEAQRVLADRPELVVPNYERYTA